MFALYIIAGVMVAFVLIAGLAYVWLVYHLLDERVKLTDIFH